MPPFIFSSISGCGAPSCPDGQAWDDRDGACVDIFGFGPDSAGPDSGSTTDPPSPTRILLLTLDTTRRDALADSPWLSALADQGTSLPRLWANTRTYPSIGKLLTSQRVIDWGPESWTATGTEALQDDVPTVLEYLHGAGFAVVAVSQNDGQAGRGTRLVNPDTSELDAYVAVGQGDPEWIVNLPGLLEPYATRDTFLWIHVAEAHDPYLQPALDCAAAVEEEASSSGCPYDLSTREELDRANHDLTTGGLVPGSAEWTACQELVDALYTCDVRYQDEELARLWTTLEDIGFLDPGTVAAIVTDHGEGLFDPWVSHGFDMRSPITGVYGLFIGPGVEAGAVVEADRSIRDVVPSLLALAGVPPMPSAEGVPYWETPVDEVIAQFDCGTDPTGTFTYRFGAIGGGQHLIRTVDDAGHSTETLYDIEADPCETHDLVADGVAPAQALTETVAASLAAVWGRGYCTGGDR